MIWKAISFQFCCIVLLHILGYLRCFLLRKCVLFRKSACPYKLKFTCQNPSFFKTIHLPWQAGLMSVPARHNYYHPSSNTFLCCAFSLKFLLGLCYLRYRLCRVICQLHFVALNIIEALLTVHISVGENANLPFTVFGMNVGRPMKKRRGVAGGGGGGGGVEEDARQTHPHHAGGEHRRKRKQARASIRKVIS